MHENCLSALFVCLTGCEIVDLVRVWLDYYEFGYEVDLWLPPALILSKGF